MSRDLGPSACGNTHTHTQSSRTAAPSEVKSGKGRGTPGFGRHRRPHSRSPFLSHDRRQQEHTSYDQPAVATIVAIIRSHAAASANTTRDASQLSARSCLCLEGLRLRRLYVYHIYSCLRRTNLRCLCSHLPYKK